MARLADRYAENADGDFFVDRRCIDCDRCRQIAPATFGGSVAAAHSYVARQPDGDAERKRARMALVACPTAAIGTQSKAPVADAMAAFPEPIEDGIHDCGFADESSFGATSYFLVRERGNVLVDAPRFVRALADRIATMGGVRTIFFTHRDDVADQARWAARFGAARIIHAADASAVPGVERVIEGKEPVPIDDDLVAIPVPGHTRGSAALLYRRRFLFTGDHVWGDDDGARLEAGRDVCWWSWTEQTRSMERLRGHDFDWVLPGHGRRLRAESAAAMRAKLEDLLARMKR